MGEKAVQRASDPEELRRFTQRLLGDLRALERMLDSDLIETGVRRIGVEQEMFLVDSDWRVAPISGLVLQCVDDPRITTELATFNIEANADPIRFGGDCLRRMEEGIESLLGRVREAALACGAEVVLTGILPTLRKSDLDLSNMTPEDRYFALNDAMSRMRGGSYNFYIKGVDELLVQHDSVMLEACNTSFQVHFQVSPSEFARLYNVAQVAIGPVLAVAVNSPFLFRRRLWQETRIALFQQSVDTRSAKPDLREMHPRVSFGSRWVETGVLDIFREDVARFKVLLGTEIDEDPMKMVESGRAPRLRALQLFNSTVYRWNRPCYGVKDGIAHLRIENRVLPSGPSVPDEVANAAFWFGLVAGLAEEHEDIRRVIAFADAKGNFRAAARQGLGAPFVWLDGEEIEARELIVGRLIDLAASGLATAGVDPQDVDHYLGLIRRRAETRQTGAAWMLRSISAMKERGTAEQRMQALTAAIAFRQRDDTPVHEWSLAELEESGGWKASHMLVEHYMTTDLVTVHEDEPIDLVANLMDWHRIRHIPVEDSEHRLIGLITRPTLLRFLASEEARKAERPVPVGDIMERQLITATPDTTTLEAIELMRSHGISCLPVVSDDRLVGLVAERDYMELARELLEERLRE